MSQAPMLFQDWGSLGRVVVLGVAGYLGALLVLRLTGNRALTKMNAFDMIVTVALGSTLADVIVSPDVTLSQGLVAMAVLVALQYAFSWLNSRSARIEHIVNGDPVLLVYRGTILRDVLRRTRVSEEEVRAAARSKGVARIEDVSALVLETDGSFSVLTAEEVDQATALADVTAFPPGVRPPPPGIGEAGMRRRPEPNPAADRQHAGR